MKANFFQRLGNTSVPQWEADSSLSKVTLQRNKNLRRMLSKIPKEIREIVIFPRGTDREQPLTAETAALHQELGALGGFPLPWVHTHTGSTPCPLSSSGTAAFWSSTPGTSPRPPVTQLWTLAMEMLHQKPSPACSPPHVPCSVTQWATPHPATHRKAESPGTRHLVPRQHSERDVWISQVPTTVQNNLLGLTAFLLLA